MVWEGSRKTREIVAATRPPFKSVAWRISYHLVLNAFLKTVRMMSVAFSLHVVLDADRSCGG